MTNINIGDWVYFINEEGNRELAQVVDLYNGHMAALRCAFGEEISRDVDELDKKVGWGLRR